MLITKKPFGFSFVNTQKLSSAVTVGTIVVGFVFGLESYAAKGFTKIEHVPGEILVTLDSKKVSNFHMAELELLGELESKLGRGKILSIRPLRTDQNIVKVKLATDRDMKASIQELEGLDSVRYAEPNYIYHLVNTPNDPDFSKLWGLKNTGQNDSSNQAGRAGSDIGVTKIWDEGHVGSHAVKVAVIDTGVDWDHDDLKANIYTNPGEAGEKAENGIDDDGNGFVDDVHGWNFAANTRNSSDDHNHGTHCSGTIGGVGNNGKGVVGVNWNVSIVPIKFLTASGSGTLEDAVESINYATSLKVNIMSNSWGGGGFSETMAEAIRKSRDAGILFVAAAGNESSDNDAQPMYPASYQVENVLAVAASDNRDDLASFSNWGRKTVHISAPGVRVYSTVKGNSYATYSGTSMATPHTAGAAALLWSILPEMTALQIKDRLIVTADRVAGLKKKSVSKGRLNVYNAVHNIIPPNDDPDESLWRDEPFHYETAHPYADKTDISFEIVAPGAQYIRVHFARIETEPSYDKVQVVDATGILADEYSGKAENVMSEYVKSDRLTIKFTSDISITDWGFKIDRIQVIR